MNGSFDEYDFPNMRFSVQPAAQTINSFGTARFTVGVLGPDPITYHWQAEYAPETWCDLTDLQPGGGGFGNAAGGRSCAFFHNVNSPTLTITPELCGRHLGIVEATRYCRLTLCISDFKGDDFVDFFGAGAFIEALESGDAAADVNVDSFLDFFDHGAFVEAFEAGC